MRYCNNQGKETERILEPLGLVCKRGVWYLFANNKIDGHRTFRVDQIQSLRTRENERFEYPQGYSLQEQIKSSWGVFCNDEVSRVRLKFSPAVAHRVQNLRYHISQRLIETCPDGSVIMQFEVCGLLELQSWILQWGNQVEVLEPAILREDICEIARQIADKYV
jgi:proteasome accessory factor B